MFKNPTELIDLKRATMTQVDQCLEQKDWEEAAKFSLLLSILQPSWEAMQAEFEKAKALDPKNPWADPALSWMALKIGDLSQALLIELNHFADLCAPPGRRNATQASLGRIGALFSLILPQTAPNLRECPLRLTSQEEALGSKAALAAADPASSTSATLTPGDSNESWTQGAKS